MGDDVEGVDVEGVDVVGVDVVGVDVVGVDVAGVDVEGVDVEALMSPLTVRLYLAPSLPVMFAAIRSPSITVSFVSIRSLRCVGILITFLNMGGLVTVGGLWIRIKKAFTIK